MSTITRNRILDPIVTQDVSTHLITRHYDDMGHPAQAGGGQSVSNMNEETCRGAGSRRLGTTQRFRRASHRWTQAVYRYVHAARSQVSTRVVRIKSKAARARYLLYRFWWRRFNVYGAYLGQETVPWSPALDLRVGAIGTKAVPLRVALQFNYSKRPLPDQEQCPVPEDGPPSRIDH
jgi:hypothetical protein